MLICCLFTVLNMHMAQHLFEFQIDRGVIACTCRPVFYAVSNVASYSSAIGVVSLAVAQDVPGSTVARARRVNRALVTFAVRKESLGSLALTASRDCLGISRASI